MANRTMDLLGVRVIVSDAVPPPGTTVPYPDWRERLRRNLQRPSTGRWEPLDYPVPNLFLVTEAREYLAHQIVGAILKQCVDFREGP